MAAGLRLQARMSTLNETTATGCVDSMAVKRRSGSGFQLCYTEATKHMHPRQASARANFRGAVSSRSRSFKTWKYWGHAADMKGMWSGSRVCPGCGHNLRSMALRSGRKPS